MDGVIDWLLGLGEEYGVDPIVYAVIWVGALPLFLLSVGWVVRRVRRGEPIWLPLTATAVFFSAPTLYVLAAGRDLPWWVYAVLGILTLVGVARTVRDVRQRSRTGERSG